MSKAQKKVETPKKEKKVSKGAKESQFMVGLSKRVNKVLKQYAFIKDKDAQIVAGGVVMSGDAVRKALKIGAPKQEQQKQQTRKKRK